MRNDGAGPVRGKLLALFAASFATLAFAGAAEACSNHPITCQQHLEQHNWNVEQARQNAEAYANSRQEARQRRNEARHEAESAPDPTQRRLDAVVAMVHVAKAQLEEIEQMKKDPRFQALRRGEWHFFQDTTTKVPGDFCAAIFMNLKGFVRVSGPGAEYEGALLTFWGPHVPMPPAMRTISVSLTQSDDGQTQTVQGFNYTDTRLRVPTGAIALAVPSAEALLSNMQDKLGFSVAVAGEAVLDIDWHSGRAARDKLRRCMAARGTSR